MGVRGPVEWTSQVNTSKVLALYIALHQPRKSHFLYRVFTMVRATFRGLRASSLHRSVPHLFLHHQPLIVSYCCYSAKRSVFRFSLFSFITLVYHYARYLFYDVVEDDDCCGLYGLGRFGDLFPCYA
jgi:hypothetical protein